MEIVKNYVKNLDWRFILLMLIGNIFVGMGVGTFKLAGLGNDAFSGMCMSLAATVGMEYAHFAIIVNLVLFVFQIAFGRKLIGLGTIVNAFGLGYIATFFYNLFSGWFGIPTKLPIQLAVVVFAVIVLSFGLSLYQKADLGVAPFDALSIIFDGWWPKIPYFWLRMATDVTCAVICYFSGGIIGIGMAVCMFGLGPVIDFFNHVFTNKLVEKMRANQ